MRSGFQRAELFEVPTDAIPIFSVGDLQNVYAHRESTWAPHYLFPEGNTLENLLWDRFFFSAIPQSLATATEPLPDGRLRVIRRDETVPALSSLRYTGGTSDPMETAAAFLIVEGAFNVNSTSTEAWKAILSSFKGVAVANRTDPTGATEPADTDHPYSRFSYPETHALDTSAADDVAEYEAWAGYRRLTDSQVNTLADRMSTFVRNNGPFFSLGTFAVNPGFSAALNSAGVNINTGPLNPTNSTPLPPSASQPIAADIPGRLTRSDILSVFGPILTVRSDTFRIRAYGESVNPVLLNADGTVPQKAIEARAWCEAVVQRVPDYVDASEDAWTPPTKPDNIAFGRRFKIVQFRWLSPSDI